jgi:hypothetical protein
VDDWVTLNSASASSTGGQALILDVIHELTEGIMGRIGGLGDQNNVWSTMDLFRYAKDISGNAVYDTSDGRDGQTTYFSADGKNLSSFTFNNEYNSDGSQANQDDTADFNEAVVFGGGYSNATLSQTELAVMDALGWNVSLPQDVFVVSGDWQTAKAWTLGFAPIELQDAFIAAGSTATSSANLTINSIGTGVGGTLNIMGYSTLAATNGTVVNSQGTTCWTTPSPLASGNLGSIDVYVGSTLQIGNTFYNKGSLTLGTNAAIDGDSATLNLSGTVKLGGGGNLVLGKPENSLFAYSTGIVNGNGLINLDNTIEGGGAIELTTFDNGSSGVVNANQALGHSLYISASNFSNEGTMEAQMGSTLGFGWGGKTETLNNSGSVDLYSNSTLDISGNFTISGGRIRFLGAGAKITSGASGPTKLINVSDIDANYTAQIGDIGSGHANDLSFLNTGVITVAGSNQTLTIDTGSNQFSNTSFINVNVGSALDIANTNNSGWIELGTNSNSDGGFGTLGVIGAVTLTGGGHVDLGRQSDAIPGNYTEGLIVPQGLLNSGSLTNVDNTIAGGGEIFLTSFDNKGTVDANQPFDGNQQLGHALQIVAGTFQNEGMLSVERLATLDLGLDGNSESLSDTGTVSVNGQGNLQISGNLTINGTGSVQLRGTGAEITSDGAGPTTFINESAIKVTATAQIGDIGTGHANDLSFVNVGTVTVWTNNTLTLDTGANQILDYGVLDALTGGNMVIDSNVEFMPYFFGTPTIEARSGRTITLAASVEDAAGANGQIEVYNGGTFIMQAGASVGAIPIDLKGGALHLHRTVSTLDVHASGSNNQLYLSSAQAAITDGPASVEFQSGSDNVVSFSNTGSAVSAVSSSGGSSGWVTLNSASATIDGAGDTVYFTNGAGQTATLSNTQGSADTVYSDLYYGTVALNSADATINGGIQNVNLNSSGETVSLSNTGPYTDNVSALNGNANVHLSNAQAAIVGPSENVTFDSGSNVANLWDNFGASDTVNSLNGSTGTVNMYNATATVSGAGNTVNFWTSGDHADITGNNDVVGFFGGPGPTPPRS